MNLRMTKVMRTTLIDKELDILGTLEEPLFKASSITSLLGETNPSQVLKRIPEDLRNEFVKKIRVASGCATHDVLYLTEFGVYLVLMRSRQPEALKYQLKIAEILKSIRLKGYAVSDNISEEQISQLKKDANSKEMLLKAQSGVIRLNDKFVSSLKKLINMYENDQSKLSGINVEELFRAEK